MGSINLAVLGSTGSIGRQTLDIARAFPDRFRVIGLAAGKNTDLLAKQISEFQPRFIYCQNEMADLSLTAIPSGIPDVDAWETQSTACALPRSIPYRLNVGSSAS